MRCFRWFLACLCLAAAAGAQTPLQQLQQQLREEARQLAARSPSETDREHLLTRQIARLADFVGKQAQGDDRWNGRLMLADFQLARGDRPAATATLRGIDAAAAPALLLVTAATMAQHLGLRTERDAWLDAALAKPAPVDDQLAMARLLQLVLREVERGEKLLARLLADASDDEARAYIRWHRGDILRDRDDLPENSGFEEFARLAKDLPSTYWGSVAADRLRATELKPGEPAIAFTAKARDGSELSLTACRGKAVVLAFFSGSDYDTATLIGKLRELQNRRREALQVIGICLDTDTAAVGNAVRTFGIDFPVIGDGKGPMLDIALRYGIEGPTVHVIDKAGKVQALGLHVGTADARAEFDDAVERACR
ncbi:MAG: redoxin domain-containing protein [Planctomycetes bacterium]|nr:redoxin domain-containing protein [Planctomycetota bacterium]